MENGLLKKLACPICKNRLAHDKRLQCQGCGQVYEVIRGIPNFLPEDLFDKFNSELKDQDLYEEKDFYERLYSNLEGLDDGHCVVYGYDEIYDFMSDFPVGSLLDVGCGAGHHSKDLALKGYKVTGIDISLNGLEQARRIKEAYNQEIDFVLGDVENLPFAENSFDIVFCGLLLHHFPRKEKLLLELTRVCSSHLVAFEVNSYDPISLFRFNILNPTIGIHNITRNQRAVSPVKLERDLRKLGFMDFALRFVDVHHYIGRYPNSLVSKCIFLYRKASKLMPYKCRHNKFMIKCKKISNVTI